ncbi:MAG: ribose/xylose/arabinose/galactoside ABC-type transport system, permease component [Microbacteriaceae bacterium]|jgi:ribose transport system permease protein|nr:ribose/xylose/arabinose/galactoside ABC-type transport system, permease component [Microbacteriaceae bacterium]
MRGVIRRIGAGQQLGIVAIIVVLVVVSTIINPTTLTQGNIIEVLRSTAIYFIAACAATLVLVGGGLDLSIGSIFAVGAIAVGLLLNLGTPWPLAVIGAIVVSGLFGAVNAFFILRIKVPPFITTLGMSFAAVGLVTVVTGGNPLFRFPDAFNNIGQLNLFGVPFLVYYAVIIGVVFHLVLERSRFGYDTRAIGGNASAALSNGVRVTRVTATLYIVSGAIAGLCGILLTARVSTADPAAGGTGFTFQVLAAVIIGGTSLFGGIGTITGTALGSLLFSVINNVLALTNTNPQWQNVATGVILVAAVAFDTARRSRRFKAGR